MKEKFLQLLDIIAKENKYPAFVLIGSGIYDKIGLEELGDIKSDFRFVKFDDLGDNVMFWSEKHPLGRISISLDDIISYENMISEFRKKLHAEYFLTGMFTKGYILSPSVITEKYTEDGDIREYMLDVIENNGEIIVTDVIPFNSQTKMKKLKFKN